METVLLGQVVNLRRESVNPSTSPSSRYVGLEHIDTSNPFLQRCGESDSVISSKNRFYPGDVLYGKLRPYLDKAALAQWEGICSTDILVLFATEQIAAEYLVYLLHTREFTDYAVSTTSGVNHPRTSWNSISAFPFVLPPLAEQRAIARVLTTVRQAIEATERVIEATRQLKKAMMKHLFTYGPVPVHAVDGVQLKETEIGWVPEGWTCGTLGDFLTLQRGFDLPSSSRKVGKTPIVSSAGISGFHDVAKVAGPGVITGRCGSIGKVHFIEQDFWPLNTTLYVKDFKCNDPKFVFYLLQTIDIQSFNDKTSVPGVNRNHLHAIKLAYPPLEQQKKIAGFLTGIDLKLESEDQQKNALYSLFQSVLLSLMTGKVRINTSDFTLE